MCIKEHPCKVSAVSTSKTGKHGHAKCNFTAIDIFTGKKYEDISPTSHTMYAPVVVRTEYQFLNPDDDDEHCMLMTDDGETREDIKMPPPHQEDNMREDILAAYEEDKLDVMVTAITAMEKEAIIAFKLVERKD
jgi:translation initiation factor 5A